MLLDALATTILLSKCMKDEKIILTWRCKVQMLLISNKLYCRIRSDKKLSLSCSPSRSSYIFVMQINITICLLSCWIQDIRGWSYLLLCGMQCCHLSSIRLRWEITYLLAPCLFQDIKSAFFSSYNVGAFNMALEDSNISDLGSSNEESFFSIVKGELSLFQRLIVALVTCDDHFWHICEIMKTSSQIVYF